jgi:AAA domain/Bifunctional DNA primase/polymerase, N-terminal
MEKLEPGVARQAPESDERLEDVAIETLSENGAAGNKEYLTALSWASKGIPVFPCKNTPGDPATHKAPHTSHGFHDATTDPDLIRSWWARWPNALIGMPTGPRSGFDVIDIDRKKGKDGTKAIPNWAEYPDGPRAGTIFHYANEADPNWDRDYWRELEDRLNEASANWDGTDDAQEPTSNDQGSGDQGEGSGAQPRADEPKAEQKPQQPKLPPKGPAVSGRYHKKWELDFVRVADIPSKRIAWLWENRIALGKLTIIAGHPGVNKSTVILDIVARITRGLKMPCGEGTAPTGNVLILTNEDDVADTIHPRLAAAGADVKRVYVIKGLVQQDKSGRRTFNLMEDVERLKKLVEQIGEVVAIVIDPVSAYLGKPGGKQDVHRDADVRAILSRFKTWPLTKV